MFEGKVQNTPGTIKNIAGAIQTGAGKHSPAPPQGVVVFGQWRTAGGAAIKGHGGQRLTGTESKTADWQAG